MNGSSAIPTPIRSHRRGGPAAALLAVLLVLPAPAAQAQSVSVTAGNLHGSAQAGPAVTSKSRPCNGQGITVRSSGGTASSSVSVSSSGGQTAVAGAGSPGSVIKHYDCRKNNTKHASRRTP
jgi:hypothetical protein